MKDLPDRKPNTRDKGAEAEDLAEKILLEKGYVILKRNFHYGKIGEIDIIAENKGELVFVEVRSKRTNDFGDPLFSITPAKQRTIRKVAEFYYYTNNIISKPCRFDAFTIDYTVNPPVVNHVENAF